MRGRPNGIGERSSRSTPWRDIPGAVSAPWAGNLDAKTGRFLPPAALRERYLELGVDAGERAISQCGSGLTACHDVLALRVAGHSGARLYVGSWSDWVSDATRPVATGPEPGTFRPSPGS